MAIYQEVMRVSFGGFYVVETVPLRRWMVTAHVGRWADQPIQTPDGDLSPLYLWAYAMANFLSEEWSDNMLPLLSSSVMFESVRTQVIAPVAGAFSEVIEHQGFGGNIEGMDDYDDCTLIRLRSSQPGRGAQGRRFIPGVPATEQHQGLQDEAYVGSIVQAWQLVFNTLPSYEAGDAQEVIFSPTKYATFPDVHLACAQVTNRQGDRVTRRQSRRTWQDTQLVPPA